MTNNLLNFRNMPVKDVKSPSMNAEPVIFGETFNATLRVNFENKQKFISTFDFWMVKWCDTVANSS